MWRRTRSTANVCGYGTQTLLLSQNVHIKILNNTRYLPFQDSKDIRYYRNALAAPNIQNKIPRQRGPVSEGLRTREVASHQRLSLWMKVYKSRARSVEAVGRDSNDEAERCNAPGQVTAGAAFVPVSAIMTTVGQSIAGSQ